MYIRIYIHTYIQVNIHTYMHIHVYTSSRQGAAAESLHAKHRWPRLQNWNTTTEAHFRPRNPGPCRVRKLRGAIPLGTISRGVAEKYQGHIRAGHVGAREVDPYSLPPVWISPCEAGYCPIRSQFTAGVFRQ